MASPRCSARPGGKPTVDGCDLPVRPKGNPAEDFDPPTKLNTNPRHGYHPWFQSGANGFRPSASLTCPMAWKQVHPLEPRGHKVNTRLKRSALHCGFWLLQNGTPRRFLDKTLAPSTQGGKSIPLYSPLKQKERKAEGPPDLPALFLAQGQGQVRGLGSRGP